MYQSFTQALNALGATDKKRAEALGVSRVTLIEYREGRMPRYIIRLMRQPILLRALADDADAQAAASVAGEVVSE